MTAAPREPITTGGGRPMSYKTKSGRKVPGVTTICNRFKESGGLVHWAWQLGMDGQDYRRARDDAGGVGHYAHALVDADIHGRELPEPPRGMSDEDAGKARRALDSFRSWRDTNRVRIVDTESPHVSELYDFGGTWDGIGQFDTTGEWLLIDWKSSNAVYREYICQVAAYRTLARAAGYPVEGASLVRFGKVHGDFTHHHWPASALDVGWDAFRLMLELYKKDQSLKEIVR